MSVSTSDLGIQVFVDPESKSEFAVVALVDRDEFAWAQIVVPSLNDYADYDDWCCSREGFEAGLAMAGVAVSFAAIAITPFLAWSRLVGVEPTEQALDEFALTISRFRKSPAPTALAVVSQQDFEDHSRDVAALSGFDDYERWLRHRRKVRARAVRSGRRVVELPILLGDFVEWTVCAGEFSDRSSHALDRYAQLALEYFSTASGT
jgi:hypothetical protein